MAQWGTMTSRRRCACKASFHGLGLSTWCPSGFAELIQTWYVDVDLAKWLTQNPGMSIMIWRRGRRFRDPLCPSWWSVAAVEGGLHRDPVWRSGLAADAGGSHVTRSVFLDLASRRIPEHTGRHRYCRIRPGDDHIISCYFPCLFLHKTCLIGRFLNLFTLKCAFLFSEMFMPMLIFCGQDVIACIKREALTGVFGEQGNSVFISVTPFTINKFISLTSRMSSII